MRESTGWTSSVPIMPDRHDRDVARAARAGRRRCARGAAGRRGCGCPRDRCRTPSRRAAPRSPTSSARSLALPPSRRIGIWPQLRKNQAVFGSSKYSALATKVTRRRTTSGMKNESRKERWFAREDHRHRAAARARVPRPGGGTKIRMNGVSRPLTIQYKPRQRTPRTDPGRRGIRRGAPVARRPGPTAARAGPRARR